MKIFEERIRGTNRGTNSDGCGVRTLTVSTLFRQWGSAHRTNEVLVPSIRLNGKWLAALGIVPGQKIRVESNGPIITITPVSAENDIGL